MGCPDSRRRGSTRGQDYPHPLATSSLRSTTMNQELNVTRMDPDSRGDQLMAVDNDESGVQDHEDDEDDDGLPS